MINLRKMEQNNQKNSNLDIIHNSLPENNNNKEIKIYETINSIIDNRSKREELIKNLV